MAKRTTKTGLISAADAAEIVGIAITTLRQHAQRGHVPGAQRLSGVWVFDADLVRGFKPAPRGRPSKPK